MLWRNNCWFTWCLNNNVFTLKHPSEGIKLVVIQIQKGKNLFGKATTALLCLGVEKIKLHGTFFDNTQILMTIKWEYFSKCIFLTLLLFVLYKSSLEQKKAFGRTQERGSFPQTAAQLFAFGFTRPSNVCNRVVSSTIVWKENTARIRGQNEQIWLNK